jgi:hypothetical protein
MLHLLTIGLSMIALACGGGPNAKKPDPVAENTVVQRSNKVLLVTATENLFLEGALLVYDKFDVAKATPAELDAMPPDQIAKLGLIILDGYAPKKPPAAPLLYFGAGEHTPIRMASRAQNPRVIAVDEKHPAMKLVTLSEVRIDESVLFAVDPARGEVALASAPGGALIAATQVGGNRVIVVGFAVGQSDLPMRAAFPSFLVNSLDWLMRRPEKKSNLE